jgi:hypothetical protein
LTRRSLGRPTLDGVLRPHLHPSARFEARPVFHYDAEAKSRGANSAKTSANSAAPALTDGDLPPSTAKTYDGRARLHEQDQSPNIDLFL